MTVSVTQRHRQGGKAQALKNKRRPTKAVTPRVSTTGEVYYLDVPVDVLTVTTNSSCQDETTLTLQTELRLVVKPFYSVGRHGFKNHKGARADE